MSTLQTTNLKHPDASGNQITFTSGGLVGVGTSDPDMILHVQSDSTYAYVAIEGASTDDSGINLKRNGSNQWFVFNDASNNDSLQIEGGGGFNDQFVTITQTGNVGIGRTTPGEKLDILSTSGNCLIKMQAPVGSVSGINAIGSNELAFQTGFVEAMRIDSSRRLLVGTSTTSTDSNNSGALGVSSKGTLMAGGGGPIVSHYAILDPGEYLELQINTVGSGIWSGFMSLTICDLANGSNRRHYTYSVFGANQYNYFLASVIHSAVSGSGTNFSIAYASVGKIRITNNSSIREEIAATFIGSLA